VSGTTATEADSVLLRTTFETIRDYEAALIDWEARVRRLRHRAEVLVAELEQVGGAEADDLAARLRLFAVRLGDGTQERRDRP
jgi:hypothetical protein